MQILNNQQIEHKIKRMAIEMYEHNYGEKEIILAGINNNGLGFAKRLKVALEEISDINVILANIRLNPSAPLSEEITIDIDMIVTHNKVILLVDDVANTGRTLFYAMRVLMNQLVKKIEIAVLVDREHKAFPMQIKYCGLSLATTLKQNIKVILDENKDNKAVHLN